MQKQEIQNFFTQYKVLVMLAVVAVIWALFYTLEPNFLTTMNISNLFRQMAITGMLAAGMMFIIVAGEIDLSVGAQLGLLGAGAAILQVNHGDVLSPYAIVALTLLGGLVIGMFNGFWVAYLRVPSFIVGLAGYMAFRGILIGMTNSETISIRGANNPDGFDLLDLGGAYLPDMYSYVLGFLLFGILAFSTFRTRANRIRYNLPVAKVQMDMLKLALFAVLIAGFVETMTAYRGIPIPVLILLVIIGAFSIMGRKTAFGRYIYAVGGNLEATHLSGVNVRVVKMMIFGLVGVMCAMAGLTTTARLSSASPAAGMGAELDAIASCIIGGTSMRGGAGTIVGAMVGALIMASLDNGMSMLGVESFWQQIVKGSILLLAVWMDVISGSKR